MSPVMSNGNPHLKRSMSDTITMASRYFPCILLTGARQVGKSTLLHSIMPEGMRYVTLDDFSTAAAARRDPVGFLEGLGTPLFIDEIQYAPDLLRAIKLKVDANRRNGMYWITGSQRFHLMKGVTESLAGRIGILELYPLSNRESCGLGEHAAYLDPAHPAESLAGGPVCGVDELFRRIWRGGYPEMVVHDDVPTDIFFRSYVTSYIERDVADLTQVADKAAFFMLMKAAALRTGEQLSYANIANDTGISPNTAKRWLSILETSGIITMLEPYFTNSTKRLVKSPKMHFMDTGLCAWLAGIRSPEELRTSQLAGHIVESWVYGQLLRGYANAGRTVNMSYFRDKAGHEVDILIEENGKIYPLEIKLSSTPMPADLANAAHIPTGRKKLAPGMVLCNVREPVPLGLGDMALPLSAL